MTGRVLISLTPVKKTFDIFWDSGNFGNRI